MLWITHMVDLIRRNLVRLCLLQEAHHQEEKLDILLPVEQVGRRGESNGKEFHI